MADDPGAFVSVHTHEMNEKKTIRQPSIDEFGRIFQAMLSTDSQERTAAEDKFEKITHYGKTFLLWKTFQTAHDQEYRLVVLDRLQAHIDLYWDLIFPNSTHSERMSTFCMEMLSALEQEMIGSVRDKITDVIIVAARWRLEENAGAQNWAELINYIESSPLSTTDKHKIVALNIVKAVPYIFGEFDNPCYRFFKHCLEDADRSLDTEVIKAYISAYASSKCSHRTGLALAELERLLSEMIRKHRVKEAGSTRNDIARQFINQCLESHNFETIMMTNRVVNRLRYDLTADCISEVKTLLELCLACPYAQVRLIAMHSFAYVITQDDNVQSSLRDLFPEYLTMFDDVEVGATTIPGERYSPLDCLEHMANRAFPLLIPHLEYLVDKGKEAISSPLQSRAANDRSKTKKRLGYEIIYGLLRSFWDDFLSLLGEDYLKQLANWTTKYICTDTDSGKYDHMQLLGTFGRKDLTAQIIKDFIKFCADSDSPRLQRTLLDLVLALPSMMDVSKMKTVIEKALDPMSASHAYLRTSALIALSLLAENRKEGAGDTLGELVPIVIKLCTAEARTFGTTEYTPISCLSSLSYGAFYLLEPHLSAVVAKMCSLILDRYVVCDKAINLVKHLCTQHSTSIESYAVGHISAILECELIESAERDWEDQRWMENFDNSPHDRPNDKKMKEIGKGLAPESILIPLVELAHRLSTEGDWKKRYIGALALWVYCERCEESAVGDAAPSLISSLHDSNSKVRNIACTALNHLAVSRAPIIQEKCPDEIASVLVILLKDIEIPRIAANAGSTLAAFIEHCPKSSTLDLASELVEIMEHLLSSFLMMLSEDRKYLLEQTIAPICAMAKAWPILIYSNYEAVMIPLRGILYEKPAGEFLGIVATAMSACGQAAGRSRFRDDGIMILSSITKDIDSLLSVDRKFTEHSLRLFALMGPETGRFLPSLVPPLIIAYKQYKELYNEDNCNFVLKRRRDTAKIVLVYLRTEMPVAFEPYVDEVSALFD